MVRNSDHFVVTNISGIYEFLSMEALKLDFART